MACVGGGIDVNWLVLAAACCVRGLVSGGGRGGLVWGWRCWWWGGRGWVLCWLGVWASLWVVWVLRVCAVRPLRFLTGCGAGVWVGGGRMSVRVGLWSVCNGWLLVDGARWYGVWVGGLLVVVGWGGRGWVLCWLGVRASLWVVWVLRVCAVWPLRFLTGCGAGVRVGGGRMSPRVGLWSVCDGWLLVDGARWHGVWVGGCWWWWGAPTRPWCCWCACAAPRGSMGVYRGSYVVGPCSGGGGWCWTAWWWCGGCAGCVWYPGVGGCGGRGWWWWNT